MGIVTRTGDKGTTSLLDATRVLKSDLRVVAYGEIDCLNSQIGLLASLHKEHPLHTKNSELNLLIDGMFAELLNVQSNLFCIGSQIATPLSNLNHPNAALYSMLPEISTESISVLEEWIERTEKALPPLKHFIFPGGTSIAATAHIARALCRRAECAVVAALNTNGELTQPAFQTPLIYLNRLSDFLFMLARCLNHLPNEPCEILWIPKREKK